MIIVILVIITVILCVALFVSIKRKAIKESNKVKNLKDSFEDIDEYIISKDKINFIKEKYRKTENIEILTKKVSKEDIEKFYKSQIEK